MTFLDSISDEIALEINIQISCSPHSITNSQNSAAEVQLIEKEGEKKENSYF